MRIIAITGRKENVEASGAKVYADKVFEKLFRLSELYKSVSKNYCQAEVTEEVI